MKHSDLLEIARKRMDEAQEAELRHREEAADDLNFLIGRQWPEEVRAEREAEGKPCLTINGLSQFVRQVTGQIRNLNPAIKVMPADGRASKETAEVIEGLIRQIENASDASSTYEAAAEGAAACGIGYWRLRADYIEGDTFDQEILIERIHNPFSVFFDPLAKHPTRSDARYVFIVEEMTREDFEAQYPGKTPADLTDEHNPHTLLHWHRGDHVVVAEYIWIEHKDHVIGQLADGTIMRDPPKGAEVLRKRTVSAPHVMWAKVTANDVLEGPVEIPCDYLPVVAVTGEEWHIGEEAYRSSVIRYAKDPQHLYNMARSAGAELMAMQPKAPYLVTARQIAGLETMWGQANLANRPYLAYNPDPAAPPPMRVPPPIPSSAVMAEIQLAGEDMKRTTGVYDASLGAQGNETSGVAIERRQMESQNSTSVYADNMIKGVIQTGKILVSMIPRVYDAKRVVRILGDDGQESLEEINSLIMSQEGVMPVNDITIGKYDVRIGVGPTYATKRQEAAEGMMDFLRAVPQAAAVTGDIIAGMQDWPDADKLRDRLRKTLPPGIVEVDDLEPEQQQAMQAQAQAAQQQEQAAMQAQMAAQEVGMREAQAKAAKAEADAKKAVAEAMRAEIEVAQMSGQIDQAVNARVAQNVNAVLSNILQPQPALPPMAP